MNMSPSGALSPYYYKGGFFHGIHYGSYFGDMAALRDMMAREEAHILRSPERRRILIDIYETDLAPAMVEELAAHVARLRDRIVKLAISGEARTMKALRRAIRATGALEEGQLFLHADMETAKTWLVSAGTR